MTAEIDEKTTRLVKVLESENLAGVVLNSQHNFAWLTGGASNGIDLSRENGAASLLVTKKGERFLLANNIEMQRLLAEQVPPEALEPAQFSWQEEKASPRLGVDLAERIAGGPVTTDIVLDPAVRAIEGLIARCRWSLTPEEAGRIRSLGSDASSALDSVVESLMPGNSERDAAGHIRSALGDRGIASVVTLVAADERIAAYRHPTPTAKRWEKVLLLVTCAKRHGLIVSLSRLICNGSIPDDLRGKTEAAAFVNASLWHATKPGASGGELYQIAEKAYAEVGFPEEIEKHHQGGTAGYKTREWVAHPTSTDTVNANQAFSWNPSITGTKIEETILITAQGLETITASEKFPKISTEIGGITYKSPGILSV